MTDPVSFSRVRCSAIVDPEPDGQWRVRVEGIAPHYLAVVYIIRAANEDEAAKQGIDRFVATQEGLDRHQAPTVP